MSLQFPTGSSELQPHYQGQIAALSEMLQQSPKLFIDLSGYTDKQGSKKLNQALSIARVNTVKNALINNGVNAERIKLFAYGEQAPVVANSEKEVSFYDRRVVIKLHSDIEQVANNY
jgi:outer membrane protein OmpA-like peptidoglycan-associated protein